jgi:hypothetical protein
MARYFCAGNNLSENFFVIKRVRKKNTCRGDHKRAKIKNVVTHMTSAKGARRSVPFIFFQIIKLNIPQAETISVAGPMMSFDDMVKTILERGKVG